VKKLKVPAPDILGDALKWYGRPRPIPKTWPGKWDGEPDPDDAGEVKAVWKVRQRGYWENDPLPGWKGEDMGPSPHVGFVQAKMPDDHGWRWMAPENLKPYCVIWDIANKVEWVEVLEDSVEVDMRRGHSLTFVRTLDDDGKPLYGPAGELIPTKRRV
jgi:hypothetical protein